VVLVIGFILCFFLGPAPSFGVPIGLILSVIVGIRVYSAINNTIIAILAAIVTGVVCSILGFFGNEKHKTSSAGFSSIKEAWDAEAEWKKSLLASSNSENKPPDSSVNAAMKPLPYGTRAPAPLPQGVVQPRVRQPVKVDETDAWVDECEKELRRREKKLNSDPDFIHK
jgi:hypothetical protein